MSATMRIPTEFTAIDKFSAVVAKMANGVGSFAKSTGSAVQRVNTKIDGVFNKLGNVTQLLLGLSAGAIFASAITDLKDYETAISSFRTIVSDLSDKDFAKYRTAVNDVAKDTKKSTIDVAKSFEKIAGLNADFAKTADGLAMVSKASIVLSKASGDDLGVSAENLVGIMNQFALSAKEADRVTNVLAAGQAVGASSITQSAEAYKNFGAVAKGANITLEQSQALIQTLGKFSLFGAEAGTKLRGATLQLQKAGLGYKSGQFSINDALEDANNISSKLTTQRAKDTFVLKTFGAENITAGKILMANVSTYEKYTKGVTGTSEAQKAAEINSATLSVKIQELKDSFTNFLTTNEQTTIGLTIAKNTMGFLADNIENVIGIAIGLVGFVAIIKAITLAMTIGQAVTAAYATITAWYSGVALTAAFTGASFASVIWATIAPILLVIAAIAAIIAIFYYWDEIVAWFSKQWETFANWISSIWDGVVKFFQEFSFVDFFISIGQAIINYMLFPLKSVLKLVAMIPGGIGDAAQAGLDKLNDMSNLSVMLGRENQQTTAPEVVNSQNQQTNTLKGGLDINIRDKGNNVSGFEQQVFGIPVNVTSTQGAF